MNLKRMISKAVLFTSVAWLACTVCLRAFAAPPSQPDLLGDVFRSPAQGIALRPPVDCKKVITGVAGQVAEFDDETNHWFLKVARVSLSTPLPLSEYKDQFGTPRDGLLEQTAKQIQTQLATVIHQDVIHAGATGQTPVGILIVRQDQGGKRRLVQRAIVEAADQLYYVLELNTPARLDPDNAAVEDAGERRAADTFNQVVDSVELLDRAAIYQDQADRLIRTRGLFANWTPSFLQSRITAERCFRLVRDGKDIGYTYELDEYDDKSGQIADTPIIRISVRSQTAPGGGADVQVQSRLISTVDRKHENWANLALLTAAPPAVSHAAPDAKPRQTFVSELGTSDQSLRATAAIPSAGGDILNAGAAGADAIQPGVNMAERWTLTVIRTSPDSASVKNEIPPFKQDLPPFYLPQAMSYMLPRLLPYKEPKNYLFAAYVPDGDHGQPAVMLRYIDVLAAAQINWDGKTITAVAVKDHIGLEGPVTTHYLNPDDGTYLGSVITVDGKDGTSTTDMILPSDADTIRRLWPNCNLTRPDRIVDQPGPG